MKRFVKVGLLLFFLVVCFLNLIVYSFSGSVNIAQAHSGRTDSSGGHNCNVGSCAGTYHYHNGGSAYVAPVVVPTSVPVVYPTAIPTRIPVVYPTAVPTIVFRSYPTNVPSVVPTLIPTLVPTEEIVSSDEGVVLGVEEVSESVSSEPLTTGDVVFALGVLGGAGWGGMKVVKAGIRGVKKVLKK